jgi:hypothetical protein
MLNMMVGIQKSVNSLPNSSKEILEKHDFQVRFSHELEPTSYIGMDKR